MKRVLRAGSPEIVKIAGDSSPSSAETSFRELDDVFLQTQTRIWLGEVLHIRFDEETTITNLLADGELLFQVSKKVWEMLLKKHVELKQSKVHIYERTSSGKSDGRYMPYPKVDSFLKICQILGLTGIDLFSPSDVVEKRDARRVCMCIRSFSKKARSKNLNVPDFDIVTYTIAMPTDLVGGIRRNLEQSQYSSSSSNGCSSPSTDLRELYRQKSHGGQNFLHYDSHSESDETESAFTELEFQSPLSNCSYDGTDFSSIIAQHSPEGNMVVDGDLSESQTQFRLDTHEHVEVVDKRSMQNGSHELKDALHSKSSLFHTECQMGVEEVMLSLRNPRNIIEINNVDISAYQNFTSNYGCSLHDLDEPHAIEAEEDFVQFGPTLRRKGVEIDLSIYSFTDSVVTLDHPKEECVKTPVDSSTEDETVSCRPVYEGVRSGYMESSKKNNILEFQDIVKEKTPPTENEVNGGKKERSSSNSFQMDPCNSVDDTSYLIVNSIDDGNDGETRAKVPNLSMESLDLEQRDEQTGLKKKAVDEIEVTKVCSTSSLVSSKDEYAGTGFTSSELDLHDSKIDISPSDYASAIDSEVEDMNEGSNSVADGNHSRRVETGFVTDPTVYACRENQDMVSNRTLSSHHPLLDKDCHSVSCSGSGFLEDDQFSESQFDSLSGSSFSFNCNPTISDCSTNESKISCSKDGYALKEDHGDVEINSDERVHNPVMPTMDGDMIGIHQPIGERKICKSTTFDVSEVQLMDNHTEGAMKVKVSQEKNASHLTYEMHENPPVEVQENNTEKLSTEDILRLDDLSIPMTIDVYSIKDNDEANGDGRRKLEPEECNEDLMPKLNSTVKAQAQDKGNKVLKSVVGTLTLIGAIFVVHHVRQKRTKDKNTEFIMPQQNHRRNREFPTQKRVEIVKPDAVPADKRYPGERLKF